MCLASLLVVVITQRNCNFGLSHFRLSPLRETTWCSIKRNGLAQKKQNLILGRLCWIIWQSPFGKLCDKMLAVSWGGAEGGWRALIRAGVSTMLFVLGRVDLLDGVTTALEGASTSWLLGLSAGGFMLPTCFGDDGLSLLFFPSWQWIFSFVPKSKNTHTHTFEMILSSTTLVGNLAEIWNLPSWERAEPNQRYWLMSYQYFTLCVEYIP